VITIAMDAMGGDRGVEATVAGAAAVSCEGQDLRVLLVGEVEAISAELRRHSYDPTRLEIVPSAGAVPMNASARAAMTDLPRCSIRVAVDLLARGEAQALVSAGHTGATVLAAAERFRRLAGVRRAALASVFPTERTHGPRRDPFALLLDCGATLSAEEEDLVAFAVMGAAYSSIISEIESPRVALLSNGTESTKGPPNVVGAHRLLANSPLNFQGNLEGMDLPRGTVDVIVCDGFLGNVVLKMMEGVSEVLRDMAREASEARLQYRLGLQMLGEGLARLDRLSDWKRYGGAPLLGLDQVVIKAHGRADDRAIRNAIKVAAKSVRGRLVPRIEEGLTALGLAPRSSP
jgi:glycerol-3-phosphate acyltransferase PlsX